jgi:nucleotide-binding universal stress UspA family protein
MVKSILLTIDGSSFSEPVLQYGIELSKKFGTQLRVLTVIDARIFEWAVAIGIEGFAPVIPSTGYQEESRKLLEQRAEDVLKKSETLLKKANIDYSLEKENGNPVDVICDKSRMVDLVIMGAKGEFARWSDKMLGATLEAATRLSIKPIMIIPNKYKKIQKILIAYDGSDNAIKALSMAAYFASQMKLPLNILTVHESSTEAKDLLSEAREYLSPYSIQSIDEKTLSGDPADKIVEFAKEFKIDLIIMGSYGHSRIREAILGSTTVQTMRKATAPLLMVK